MQSPDLPSSEWVVLTMGDRMTELRAAIASVHAADPGAPVTVVWNGVQPVDLDGVSSVAVPENLGVPGGRDLGLRRSAADIVIFLDDDACFQSGRIDEMLRGFRDEPDLSVVAMRLVDEHGESSRRHVPRIGGRAITRARDVAHFLGGACAVRRSAYVEVGGYWEALWYGHEELDLAWRLADAGYRIRYEPALTVMHPRTAISRHPSGWLLTGRNRVMVARRDLPWPIAIFHALFWLTVGVARAPAGDCRRSYVRGWRSGWSRPVERSAMRWTTVVRLARVGRPPLV